ncbi:MAG: S8 family serine peptidase, partial [Candidatus Kapabacteria bacterium]|nr:S8 family serine peptidase [Candidatus Kapabacteria bacterium]
ILTLNVANSSAQTLNTTNEYLTDRIFVRMKPGSSLDELRAYPELQLGGVQQPLLPANLSYRNTAIAKNNQLLGTEQKIENAEEPLMRTYIIQLTNNSANQNIPLLCSKLMRACTGVDIAEPYFVYQVLGRFTPNDTLIGRQSMLDTMKAFEAWDIFKGDTSVIIGISDSGILQEHPDYSGTLHSNTKEIPNNSIDDDGNGYTDDYRGVNFAFADDTTKPGNTFNSGEGHGTGVAGIASATVDNITGTAGTGFRSRFFPMKTMPNNLRAIIYGYQSIMYAAQNGIKVINLSWGGSAYSCVMQSVVDYAVARDVSVVAAVGNHGSSSPLYPANYRGVLGVGVTEPTDTISGMSAFGQHLDIFAPGNQTWTTGNDTGYVKFCCTSGAAPVVSGIVALVRGRFKELNAVQALEHTRLCTDDISRYNQHQTKYKDMMPGRINMLKAVTRPPFSTPAISAVDWKYNRKGSPVTRAGVGDTLELVLVVENVLGASNNVTYSFSTAEDSTSAVQILTPSLTRPIARNERDILTGIKILILNKSTRKLFIRVSMQARGETDSLYSDFFLIPFTPHPTFTTWDNGITRFSAADNGRLGFAEPITGVGGVGYGYRETCNMLFEGGLMVVEPQTKRVVSCVRAKYPEYHDHFLNTKPLFGTDDTISIFTDAKAPDSLRIGIEATQTIHPPTGTNPLIRVTTRIKNTSGRILNNVGAGYFFDIDLGMMPDGNKVRLFPEGIAPQFNGTAAAGIAERSPADATFAAMSYSSFTPSSGQFSGMDNVSTYIGDGFTNDYKISTLTNGTANIWRGAGDVCMVSGILFGGEWLPDDVREFTTVIGADSTPRTLAARLQNLLDSRISSVPDIDGNQEYSLHPLPSVGDVSIRSNNGEQSGVREVVVYSLLGTRVTARRWDSATEPECRLALHSLPAGLYTVTVECKGNIHSMPLVL